MARLLNALGLISMSASMELTHENWDEATEGKTVFVKFFEPGCSRCKELKPAWDQLMEDYDDREYSLVADVDCAGAGRELCEMHDVQQFPTLKWGSPFNLEDYEGEQNYYEFQIFAAHNLNPTCSPMNKRRCDAGKKREIAELMALAEAELDEKIEAEEREIKDLEKYYSVEVEKLKESLARLEKQKTEKHAEIYHAGLGLIRAVKAAKARQTPRSTGTDH